jgi:DNA-binding NarL/FixJ family response regulator
VDHSDTCFEKHEDVNQKQYFMIRIFIIEDHITITQAGFRNLFRPGRDQIDITGAATSIEETLKNADPENTDLFILDLWLPDANPLENIRLLREHFPGKGIIIYTSESSALWKRRMIKAGALAYILKSAERADIKTAIEKAYIGETYFSGTFESTELDEIIREPNIENKKISPAQKEIVRMIKEGYKHKEIAKVIGVSTSRIEKILSALRSDYHVANNFQLVSLFTELNII